MISPPWRGVVEGRVARAEDLADVARATRSGRAGRGRISFTRPRFAVVVVRAGAIDRFEDRQVAGKFSSPSLMDLAEDEEALALVWMSTTKSFSW